MRPQTPLNFWEESPSLREAFLDSDEWVSSPHRPYEIEELSPEEGLVLHGYWADDDETFVVVDCLQIQGDSSISQLPLTERRKRFLEIQDDYDNLCFENWFEDKRAHLEKCEYGIYLRSKGARFAPGFSQSFYYAARKDRIFVLSQLERTRVAFIAKVGDLAVQLWSGEPAQVRSLVNSTTFDPELSGYVAEIDVFSLPAPTGVVFRGWDFEAEVTTLEKVEVTSCGATLLGSWDSFKELVKKNDDGNRGGGFYFNFV